MLQFLKYTAYGVLGVLGVGREESVLVVCCTAPEDGRVSPKHIELKLHNKYCIKLVN